MAIRLINMFGVSHDFVEIWSEMILALRANVPEFLSKDAVQCFLVSEQSMTFFTKCCILLSG